MRHLVAPFLVLAVAATGVDGQDRRAGYPDPQTVVVSYLEGGIYRAPTYAMCPVPGTWADSIFLELQRTQLPPHRVFDIALTWTGGIRMCNDPRIEAWYVLRLREARPERDGFLFMIAAEVLLRDGSPPARSLALEKLLDPAWHEDWRSEVLLSVTADRSLEDRVRLFLQVLELERSGSADIPHLYFANELDRLIHLDMERGGDLREELLELPGPALTENRRARVLGFLIDTVLFNPDAASDPFTGLLLDHFRAIEADATLDRSARTRARNKIRIIEHSLSTPPER